MSIREELIILVLILGFIRYFYSQASYIPNFQCPFVKIFLILMFNFGLLREKILNRSFHHTLRKNQIAKKKIYCHLVENTQNLLVVIQVLNHKMGRAKKNVLNGF